MQGVFRFRDLYRAYLACRRRKRGTRDAQRYELALLDHLVDTRERLRAGRWSPATPRCFAVRRPKAREIHAAAFADRVVHHWLVQRGNQFERLMPPSRALAAAEGRAKSGGTEGATPNATLPMRRLDAVMTQLRRRRRTHALITEAGHLKGGLKRRVLRRVVLFETQPGETPCALPAA